MRGKPLKTQTQLAVTPALDGAAANRVCVFRA